MKKRQEYFGYEFSEQTDKTDRVCPYCGYDYQVEGEDYSDDVRAEECEECGKKYFAYESFFVTHHAVPDCELNGEAHKWISEKVSANGFHDFCAVCSKCRP